MAKALTKLQPTSSVNRFLKNTAFEGALDPVEDLEEDQPSTVAAEPPPQIVVPVTPKSRVAGEIVPKRETKQTAQRQTSFEVVLPSDMNDLVNDLHALFRDNSGASLNRSQLFRALLRAVKQNMSGIEKEASRLGPLKRPSNNPGFEEERELFEETLAQVFVRGISGR